MRAVNQITSALEKKCTWSIFKINELLTKHNTSYYHIETIENTIILVHWRTNIYDSKA